MIRRAIWAVTGVFPVPPTAIFPMDITGRGSFRALRMPDRYNPVRISWTSAYTSDSGIRGPRTRQLQAPDVVPLAIPLQYAEKDAFIGNRQLSPRVVA